MAVELNAMPQASTLKPSLSASQIMNTLIANDPVLANGLQGVTFTSDNFQAMGNLILNDSNLRNQFYTTLHDKIGLTRVAGMSFRNKLKRFKKDMLNSGDTVEEIAMDTIEPMLYNPEVDWQKAFKNYRATYGEIYHRINRLDVFPMTMNKDVLKRAFTSEGAFMQFLNTQLSLLDTSNEIKEFKDFCKLVNYVAGQRSYQVGVGTSFSSQTDYYNLKASIETYIEKLSFPTRNYNMFHFERATEVSKLVLFVTPDVASKLATYVQMGAFNLEYVTNIVKNAITVPELPENCLALLCDEEVLQIYDVLYATDNNHNGLTRSDNYFLHVQQIISASMQWNSVAFYQIASGQFSTPTKASCSIDPEEAELVKGETYPITFNIWSAGGFRQVYFTLEGNNDENTQITPYGLLYIGQKETASTITVKATNMVGTFTHELVFTIDQ